MWIWDFRLIAGDDIHNNIHVNTRQDRYIELWVYKTWRNNIVLNIIITNSFPSSIFLLCGWACFVLLFSKARPLWPSWLESVFVCLNNFLFGDNLPNLNISIDVFIIRQCIGVAELDLLVVSETRYGHQRHLWLSLAFLGSWTQWQQPTFWLKVQTPLVWNTSFIRWPSTLGHLICSILSNEWSFKIFLGWNSQIMELCAMQSPISQIVGTIYFISHSLRQWRRWYMTWSRRPLWMNSPTYCLTRSLDNDRITAVTCSCKIKRLFHHVS